MEISIMRVRLAFWVAVSFAWLAACSSRAGFGGGSPDSGDGFESDDGGSNGAMGGGSPSSGGPSGVFTSVGDGGPTYVSSGPCTPGHYAGKFAGSYSSHLTAVGVPIPVAGNVELDLDQAGAADQTCIPAGEIPVPCNKVFTLQNGTITGAADAFHLGDASIGGFPYFCTMSGTLDCDSKRLDDGWIQCTYCVGRLADGGMACELLNGVLGTTGVGGHFAGPLTANYDVSTLSFVMGTWNGAEALAGNDGGSPGPDGGPISDYLTKDGGFYLGPKHFGGVGTWNATYDQDH
jgi:hypothetical protein